MKKLIIVASLLSLTACDGQNARDMLGLDRKAPDEFRVVSRPPLSTPPDFQLRPPVEGEDSLGLPPADLQAKSLIVDGKDISDIDYDIRRKMGVAETAVGVVDAYAIGSQADNALLSRAGVSKADPNIRERIYKERVKTKEEAKDNWLVPTKTEDVIVDAKKEKARIKANAEAGKAITEGDTPVVEPAERGVLETLF
ncbi:MAG: DUF3035 domain-containing protein [Rickettsiales bacterium]|nr:DUF3035 domain-containing protein [Rickettsiales bacterium]